MTAWTTSATTDIPDEYDTVISEDAGNAPLDIRRPISTTIVLTKEPTGNGPRFNLDGRDRRPRNPGDVAHHHAVRGLTITFVADDGDGVAEFHAP